MHHEMDTDSRVVYMAQCVYATCSQPNAACRACKDTAVQSYPVLSSSQPARVPRKPRLLFQRLLGPAWVFAGRAHARAAGIACARVSTSSRAQRVRSARTARVCGARGR
eukprot:4350338-Pleurochrysis_carterae.AAC.3